jgi:hypothetical protein
MPSIVIAPSMLLKEMWDSDDFKSMFHEIFNNLHENSVAEKEQETDNYLGNLYQYLQYNKDQHYHMKWNITTHDIDEEMSR